MNVEPTSSTPISVDLNPDVVEFDMDFEDGVIIKAMTGNAIEGVKLKGGGELGGGYEHLDTNSLRNPWVGKFQLFTLAGNEFNLVDVFDGEQLFALPENVLWPQ